MKKLFMVLAVASLFLATNVFAASYTAIMYAAENNGAVAGMAGTAGSPITADYFFSITTDASDNIVTLTGVFRAWTAYSAGGYDTDTGAAYALGEQIFDNTKTMSIISYNGAAGGAGGGMWWRGQSNPTGTFGGMVFNVGLFATGVGSTRSYYDPSTDLGTILVGPGTDLAEAYIFHGVPIPGALWLLGSGLIGLIGLRKNFGRY